MATRLRHYDGKFGPVCPDGWRRVEVGETLLHGDRFWSRYSNSWYACRGVGEVVTPAHCLRIRQIDSDSGASVSADAPASVNVPRCPDGKPFVLEVPKLPIGYRFATAQDYLRPKPDNALCFEAGDAWERPFPNGVYQPRTVYALPISYAPQDSPATCSNCADLRQQLEATLRRVEAADKERAIAESACVAAEKACVYHQGEADKVREERDAARVELAVSKSDTEQAQLKLREANAAWAVVERERDDARRERDSAIVVLRVLCGREE